MDPHRVRLTGERLRLPIRDAEGRVLQLHEDLGEGPLHDGARQQLTYPLELVQLEELATELRLLYPRSEEVPLLSRRRARRRGEVTARPLLAAGGGRDWRRFRRLAVACSLDCVGVRSPLGVGQDGVDAGYAIALDPDRIAVHTSGVDRLLHR